MSFDEFDTIERLLGWKTEYWDGYAHLTPRGMGVKTRLDFESVSVLKAISKDIGHPEFTFITPTPDHTQQMIDGYIASFINSVEFCGWPIADIFEEAHRDISLYFEGKRGKPLSASAIALDPKTQQVIALSLISEKQQSARLELLYVRPLYQRQGIGTDLIHHSVRALRQQGYSQLTSRYHICNHHSCEFYHKLGFRDVCDRYYLRIYTSWLRNEIHRRESLRMLSGIEEMKQEQKQLENKLETLEEEFTHSIREAAR